MTEGAIERLKVEDQGRETGESGQLWRIGSASLFLMLLVIDFLALDDITTAGAWMPEILFLVASLPALVTSGYYTFRKSTGRRALPSPETNRQLSP